jgi:predicted flavoprotein YhiN
VELKTEADGRMFPVTDDSETIVQSLRDAADAAGVEVQCRARVVHVREIENGISDGDGDGDGRIDRFQVEYLQGGKERVRVSCRSILLATGGAREGHALIEKDLNLRLVPPVPSLFTLDISPDDGAIDGLAGVSVPDTIVRLSVQEEASDGVAHASGAAAAPRRGRRRGGHKKGKRGTYEERGPCLITHKGLSGPACLRLSAFAARDLAASRYRGTLTVDFAPDLNQEEVIGACRRFGSSSPKRMVAGYSPVGLPKRLWARLVTRAGVDAGASWAAVSKAELRSLAEAVCQSSFEVVGKGTFKEEFVTAGGAALSELDSRTFESRTTSGVFLAGECIECASLTRRSNARTLPPMPP